MPLNMVKVTGTIEDAALNGLGGDVTFTPVAVLTAGSAAVPVVVTDVYDEVVIQTAGVSLPLGDGQFAVELVATDNAATVPPGWMYQVTTQIAGVPPSSFTFLLPSSPATVDFSQLVPATSAVTLVSYATSALLNAETTRAEAAESAEVTTAEAFATSAVAAETVRAVAAEGTLAASVTSEAARATAAEAAAVTTSETFATSTVATETTRATAAEAAAVATAETFATAAVAALMLWWR